MMKQGIISIKAKIILFIAVILLLAFAGMSISNYFTSQRGIIDRITQQELPVYIDNIYNSIQTSIWKEIMVSDKAQKMVLKTLPGIQKTSSLFHGVVLANIEQISAAELVNSAVHQLDHIAQQNADSAEKLNKNAGLFKEQSEKLKLIISYFKL
jgi:hypothetical protein